MEVSDITNGSLSTTNGSVVWSGTGIFDKLISAVNANIQAQYESGRITAPDYATAYVSSLQAVLQQSVLYSVEVEKIKLTKLPSMVR